MKTTNRLRRRRRPDVGTDTRNWTHRIVVRSRRSMVCRRPPKSIWAPVFPKCSTSVRSKSIVPPLGYTRRRTTSTFSLAAMKAYTTWTWTNCTTRPSTSSTRGKPFGSSSSKTCWCRCPAKRHTYTDMIYFCSTPRRMSRSGFPWTPWLIEYRNAWCLRSSSPRAKWPTLRAVPSAVSDAIRTTATSICAAPHLTAYSSCSGTTRWISSCCWKWVTLQWHLISFILLSLSNDLSSNRWKWRTLFLISTTSLNRWIGSDCFAFVSEICSQIHSKVY